MICRGLWQGEKPTGLVCGWESERGVTHTQLLAGGVGEEKSLAGFYPSVGYLCVSTTPCIQHFNAQEVW